LNFLSDISYFLSIEVINTHPTIDNANIPNPATKHIYKGLLFPIIGVIKLLNDPPNIGKAKDIPIAKDNSAFPNHIDTIVDYATYTHSDPIPNNTLPTIIMPYDLEYIAIQFTTYPDKLILKNINITILGPNLPTNKPANKGAKIFGKE